MEVLLLVGVVGLASAAAIGLGSRVEVAKERIRRIAESEPRPFDPPEKRAARRDLRQELGV
jgi:hypothetical protein